MLKILTVCTGNVCRSPIAEQLLAEHLKGLPVQIESAGTRARDGMGMTAEATKFAIALGVPEGLAAAHQARYLTGHRLASADLALAMARDHRREIVELNPAFLRKTFTVREIHRLVSTVGDGALEAAADSAREQTHGSRLAGILAYVASLRGTVPPPNTLEVDDVIDPFGRSLRTYEMSVSQIDEALPSVERLVRLATLRGGSLI
ncbi:low molecular weight phosphatase family protein [Microbacterium sp. NPDC090007]|uniref:arsenate reductase/protein-tyrosine-phosphatase family protein n=1 Tax=Microbacterium sp. NPDC090007 TaxID=3364204 RepID=UPI0038113CD7